MATENSDMTIDAPEGRQISPGADKVLFVTSEITDYAQTGGLGEVSAALPRALRAMADVRILIPGYRQVLEKIGAVDLVAALPGHGDIPPCALGRGATHDGIPVYVVLCGQLYDRPGGLYLDPEARDWPDNDLRFARLSLAAADIAAGKGDPNWKPDNLHLNDWPSALAAGYLAWRGVDTPSLLTIHNLAYQGVFDRARLAALGIPDDAFRVDGIEFYGKLSFLKAGVFYADHLTTVSETYAQEITTAQFGCGLHGLLSERSRAGRLTGILNGIDESWDPSHAGHDGDSERWKGRHADYVRGAFGLALSRGPLFAIVSRLVHQKGVDLAIDAAESIVEQGGQLVVTGQGEPRFEDAMRELEARHRGPGWRAHRLRRPGGARHVCGQRLPADAVSLRTLRPQPDVCATFRLTADRASHRRPRRHDRGRAHGLAVRRAVGAASAQRGEARLRHFRLQRTIHGDAPRRDGAPLRLVGLRGTLRRHLRQRARLTPRGQSGERLPHR
jgi:ADP-glucose type glycogen/starch synthase